MKKPTSLKDFKNTRQVIKSVNKKVQDDLSKVDKIALWITDHVGSMGFFLIIFVWTVSWLGWNVLAPAKSQFDPAPAFVFWLFVSNMIQIFLMPLIMIGQNVQSRQAFIHADHDFEVNVKAEREIEVVLEHLEYQNDLILKLLDKKKKKSL